MVKKRVTADKDCSICGGESVIIVIDTSSKGQMNGHLTLCEKHFREFIKFSEELYGEKKGS